MEMQEELERNVVECNIKLRKVEERFQAEIAEHMKAADLLQKESERSSILLQLYNKALQLSDKELYDYTLDQVVQLTDSVIGFFHIVSDDQKELILTTWNRGALDNCNALYEYHYPVEEAGNWVDCVRLKRPVIYNDFPNSPNQKGLPEGHVPVLRFMSIPVLEEDKVRIIFGVGNKTEPYGDRDVVQLQLVANELHKIIKLRSLQGDKDKADAALQKAYDELELKVQERTHQLKERTVQLQALLTEQDCIEQALRESENYYRTIFENTGTAMLVIEEDITISLVNTEAEKLFGYSREELEGRKKWVEFVAKDELERLEERHRLRKMDPARVPKVYEFNLINKQGAVRNISMTVAIIPGTMKSVASLLDITERKEAERKLQEANEKLSSSVKELEGRTAEMSQLLEMGEQLQSCQTIEEACTISAQYVQKLFPSSQGALYLISPSRDLAEAVKAWGDSASTEKMFMPLNCWAIRRGRPHLVDRSHPGLLCGHITGPQAGQYLCVPMMIHGEALGILHLNHPAPEQEQQKSMDRLSSEHKTQLALAAAEHIALAIGNLRLQETLRQQAIRDTLTGLFNRRHMEESLARELCRAQREKKPVGVIMFDIDHFRDFKDLFGHAGVDALLREMGGFLIKSTHGGDIVSRYGGEEFVYVLPGDALEDTRLRAEELRQGVKELLVYHLGKPVGKITISFGVAAFPEHGLTSEEILKSAGTALSRAISEGRDRVVVASAIG
jgi:diguanylate cyclase (GGDEF)-like protein/PAS domain S-box-containing protein